MSDNLLVDLQNFQNYKSWKERVEQIPKFEKIANTDTVGVIIATDVNRNVIGVFDVEFNTGTIWS